ncbi:MAG: AAA family ATPase [Steroidobacteraceae bacterium]
MWNAVVLDMGARLILVTGSPGSGKSTLAARLAARYGCAVLDKDTIKEALFDALGAGAGSGGGPGTGTGAAGGSRRLSDASFAVQFALAGPLLDCGATLVLEGNFRPGEHEAPLARLLAARPVPFAQVLLEAPATLRAAQLAARAADPARHPGHADAAAAVPAAAAGALALPGPLWRLAGDAGEAEFARLCGALDQWWSTSSTSA